jgi:uncharacterized repeat protein (TIGR01451 family)
VVTSDQGTANPGAGDPVTTTLVAPPGLTAAFIPTLSNISAGETVHFTDTSTTDLEAPPIVSWHWDFGNGTSSDQNPERTYPLGGTYVVTLTVTDECGSTDVTTGTVVVDEPLLSVGKEATGAFIQGVPFTYTLTITNDGQAEATGVVVTDALPSDAYYVSGGAFDGSIVEWNGLTVPAEGGTTEVDFVVTSCQQMVNNADYRVAGSDQMVGSAPGAALETSLSAPNLVAGFLPASTTVQKGATVQFTDTSTTDGGPVTWLWDFGDEQTSTAEDPAHTYTERGSYKVTLYMTDTCGFSDSYVGYVTVESPVFTLTKTATDAAVKGAPLTYTIAVTNTGDAIGNDVVITDALPTGANHVSGGTLSGTVVRLTIDEILVSQGKRTRFVVTSCQASLSNQSYRVADSEFGVGSDWGPVVDSTLSDPTLVPSFTQSADWALPGQSVVFTDTTTTDGGPIVAWHWDFGDGTSTAQNPAHTYNTPGTYTVTMTVTDTCNFADTVTGQVIVQQPEFDLHKTLTGDLVRGRWLTYTIHVTNTGTMPGNNVVITDALPSGAHYISGGTLNAGQVVSWANLTIAPAEHVTRTFMVSSCQATLNNDYYRVSASADGQVLASAEGTPVQRILEQPTLTPNFVPQGVTVGLNETVHFTDTSTTDGGPIVAWHWDFGDLQQASGKHVTHTYTSGGDYQVTLTITDTCGESDTTQTWITVRSPAFSVEKVADPTPVIGAPFAYTITVTNSGDYTGTNVVITDVLPLSTYHVSGGTLVDNSTVSMTIPTIGPNGGQETAGFVITTCQASVTNAHYRVADSLQKVDSVEGTSVETTLDTPTLVPSFTIPSSIVPVGGNVTFEDATTSDGGPITAWKWDFGDGTLSSGEPATHVYTQTGTYTVTMTVTDTCGFNGTTSRVVEVTDHQIYLPLVLKGGKEKIYLPVVFRNFD